MDLFIQSFVRHPDERAKQQKKNAHLELGREGGSRRRVLRVTSLGDSYKAVSEDGIPQGGHAGQEELGTKGWSLRSASLSGSGFQPWPLVETTWRL